MKMQDLNRVHGTNRVSAVRGRMIFYATLNRVHGTCLRMYAEHVCDFGTYLRFLNMSECSNNMFELMIFFENL